MKKILFSLCALGLASQMQAQTITNGNFEAWTSESSSGTTFDRPEGWHASDIMLNDLSTLLMLAGYPVTATAQVSQSTNAHEGDYAARIMSMDLGSSFGVTPCLIVNGEPSIDIVTMGEALAGGEVDLTSVVQVNGGTPLMGRRADSISVWVSTPNYNEDTAAILIQAKKISGDSLITIGTGAAYFGPDMEYTRVAISIDYDDASNTIADTLVIFAISSAGIPSEDGTTLFNATLENSLFIDEMALHTTDISGVLPAAKSDLGVTLFPNPATSSIQIKNTSAKELMLQIYDLNGRVMHSKSLPEGQSSIDLQQYPAGNYVYLVADPNSLDKQSGTFTKK